MADISKITLPNNGGTYNLKDTAARDSAQSAYDLAASKTSNTGTVTSVITGTGLTGGPISTSGEIKAKLKSETALTVDSAAGSVVSGKVYSVVPDKSGNLAVAVPWDNAVTYSQGTGISISGTTISNSGVRSINSGTSNGTISVNTNGTTSNVAVTGLGSAAYTASTDYIASSLKGANSGVAELDATGHVPTSQLPSYVDDVLEYTNQAGFPSTGETGKIYVDKATNLTYRWSGTAYVEISPSLAIGTTSSTAFRGDYGQSAYTHAVTNKGSAFTSGLYKITTNSEGHVTLATAVQKSDITALGIPDSDTTYSSMTAAEITAGNGTTARLITPANLKIAIQTWDSNTDIAYDSTNAKLTKTVDGVTSDVFTVDATPVQNSKNPVQSGGVHTGFLMLAEAIGNDPLNTTAQTLVGALNELDSDISTINTTLSGLSQKEDKSNKVTSLSSSSTDTQYPSAKCVYDIIGDIETVLASLR